MFKLRKYKYILSALIVAFFLILSFLVCGGTGIVHAATSKEYSNVFDDLNSDSNFNTKNYPLSANDTSIQIIQVAESSDGELFIYTYQPSGENLNLVLGWINFSQSVGETGFHSYYLTLCNSDGVFYKYVVDDFTVSTNNVRYYNIARVNLSWASSDLLTTGSKVSAIAYSVGQLWTAVSVNGNVYYTMTYSEVITITDKLCGFVRYSEGVTWSSNSGLSSCDGHFVAFSCNYAMDKLLAARVAFTEQTYSSTAFNTTYGDEIDSEKYIVHDEYASNSPGLFGKSYSWQRISTGSEFANNSALSDEYKAEISNYQWVLNFYETSYVAGEGTIWAYLFTPLGVGGFIAAQNSSGTLVSNISILELTFELDGETYTLGVVDNIDVGSIDPIESIGGATELPDVFDNLFDFSNSDGSIMSIVTKVLGLILLVVILVILIPVLIPILSALIKGIVYLITLPFKAISKAIKGSKKNE